MIKYEVIPEWIKRKRQLWGSERDTWLNKVTKEEEIYYVDVEGTGTAFTVKQLEKIDEGSNIPVTLNTAYPKVNQKLAILANNKPSFRIVGADNRGKQFAEVLDKAIKSIMYRSEAIGEEEETIKNMLVLGMGISAIQEKEYYQYGTFNIEYVDVHPSMVILDMNAKKRSLKDQTGYFIEKEITLEEAKDKYQPIIDAINKERVAKGDREMVRIEDFTTSLSTTPQGRGKIKTDGFNNKIVVSEFYNMKRTTMYYLHDPETKEVTPVFQENLDNEAEFVLEGAIDKEENKFVQKYLMLGNYLIAQVMLPIRDYSLKVKFFEWGGRPYRSYGVIHFIKGAIDGIDKTTQNMIVNGMLVNNAGYLVPKNSIHPMDKDKWEKQGNKAGVLKEYIPQTIDGQMFLPEREQIQSLSNFYPTLLSMLQTFINDSTGVTQIVEGNPGAGIEVFSSLQQYTNSAMERIKLAMSHVNLANEQLGRVAVDYLLANLNLKQNYVFFDETDELNELNILKESMKDFKLARYLVLSIASQAMPTQKLAQATELFKIAQTTPDPQEKNIYIKKAFSLSDERGFDDLQKELDTVKKLSRQIQGLTEQINRDEELMKQYENRALNAEYKARLAEKLAGMLSKLETEQAKSEKDIEINQLETQMKKMQENKKTVAS